MILVEDAYQFNEDVVLKGSWGVKYKTHVESSDLKLGPLKSRPSRSLFGNELRVKGGTTVSVTISYKGRETNLHVVDYKVREKGQKIRGGDAWINFPNKPSIHLNQENLAAEIPDFPVSVEYEPSGGDE